MPPIHARRLRLIRVNSPSCLRSFLTSSGPASAPTLMRGRYHDQLFPGIARDLKLGRNLGAQITRLLWKRLGLKITPHQFRHAAGAILLQKYPGNYEQLRRVLGHRYITTTINRYVGLESIAASQRFAELVDANVPPGAVIETFEFEIAFLTSNRYHFPPTSVMDDGHRVVQFREPKGLMERYRVPGAPSYLVTGTFSTLTGLYQADLRSGRFERIASRGPYTLFRRIS